MKLIILFFLVVSTSVYCRANDLGPIGVMLDHTHPEGEGMISYRLMKMSMKGLSRKGRRVSADEYFSGSSYMMAPKDMEMTMHMLGGMYAFTDNLSLSLMVNYLDQRMTMTRRMGRQDVKSKNSGFGDTSLNAIYSIVDNERTRFVIAGGAIIPTGSIDKKNNGVLLAPIMQNGTGSYGLYSSVTYGRFYGSFSFGSQLGFKSYINDNSEDYRFGNQYNFGLWTSLAYDNNLSFSLRLNHNVQDVFKFDENRTMSSATDMRFLHGSSSVATVGINYLNTGYFKGQRLALEYGREFDSDFSGYRLELEDTLTLGWQKAF